ncbi:MAG: serine/threonine-protein kinase [Salinibacter sp.]
MEKISQTEFAELEIENEHEIGSGQAQNSTCYKSYDPQLEREIVAKYLDIHSMSGFDEYYQEARLLHRARHSNIAEVLYACQTDEHIIIVMDYYPGGSLKDVVQQDYLTVREVINYALEFLTGLHHVHTKDLLHFDIKPSNVLIDVTGRGRLADFGMAKLRNEAGLARPDALWPMHMPPEQAGAGRNEQVSTKSDIYQAGVTLYTMLNGFDHLQRQYQDLENESNPRAFEFAVADGNFPDRHDYLPHVPQHLRTIVDRAMNPQEAERYDSVLELMEGLARIDYSLDWKFDDQPAEQGVQKRWKSPFDNHERVARVHPPSYDSKRHLTDQWDLETRCYYESGTEQRDTDGCAYGLASEEEADRAFRDYLRSLKD